MIDQEKSVQNSDSANSYEDSMNRDEENTIESYHGRNNIDETPQNDTLPTKPLSRSSSIIERVQSKYSFFHENLKNERKYLAIRFLSIYATMGFFILGIFSIYWGAAYGRDGRIKNLRFLVVIEDDIEVNGVDPLIGTTFKSLFDTDMAKHYGDWHIYNSTEFEPLANEHDNTVEQEIKRLIHHQEYWASIYVKPNASYNLYNAIVTGDTNYNVTNNTIMSAYETGRDIMAMGAYVVRSLEIIQQLWLDAQNEVSLKLIQSVDNRTEIFSNDDSIFVLASPIVFNFVDYIPWTEPVLVAPSQVGLIYMIIVTFFQVNFFAEIHQQVAKYNLKPISYISYRYVSAVASFFVLSFFYSLVSLAMQVDFTVTFGRSGFLVYWMLSFLTMWAVGSANELVALILIPIFPPLLGFWLLFWVIANITPTFTPLALSPKFFRYGYGLPIHNSAEATKVVFFNTYKGEMGRNFGVIVAWIVIIAVCYPFALRYFGKSMAKKAQAAQAAQAAKAAETISEKTK